jgi:hypothetical protein
MDKEDTSVTTRSGSPAVSQRQRVGPWTLSYVDGSMLSKIEAFMLSRVEASKGLLH